MDVSIIIINYNTPQLVRDCIKSIREYTYNISYEIIVVDNASNIDSRILFNKFPEITYIYSEENLGFGKANNLGSLYAKGEYLFFLNSDTLLYKNCIKDLWWFCENYKDKLGAIGLQLIDEKGSFIHSAGSFPTILTELIGYYKNIHLPIQNDYQIVDYITGADLLIKKEIFQFIGGFDKNFFMYYEETDLQKRLANKGYNNILLNIDGIIHLEGGSFNQSIQKTPIRRLQMQLDSRFTYMKKHLSGTKYIIFRILYLLRALPTALLFKCELKLKIKYLKSLI